MTHQAITHRRRRGADHLVVDIEHDSAGAEHREHIAHAFGHQGLRCRRRVTERGIAAARPHHEHANGEADDPAQGPGKHGVHAPKPMPALPRPGPGAPRYDRDREQ